MVIFFYMSFLELMNILTLWIDVFHKFDLLHSLRTNVYTLNSHVDTAKTMLHLVKFLVFLHDFFNLFFSQWTNDFLKCLSLIYRSSPG